MSETTTVTASTTPDAAKAADESVLKGVSAPATTKKSAPRKPASKKAPAAPAKPADRTGAARYGTGYVPPRAMVQFTKWIEREYGPLDKIEPARLVSIASKAYGYFQKSNLNK